MCVCACVGESEREIETGRVSAKAMTEAGHEVLERQGWGGEEECNITQ